MTAIPVSKQKYTLEEYMELDKNSEEKYEFFDGEVFAMAGGKLQPFAPQYGYWLFV